MTQHLQALPQLTGQPFLTDGGLETTLIFRDGMDLPYFAAFHLLSHAGGRAALERYFRGYAEMAKQHRVGCVLESATWRASRDWGVKLGYSSADLLGANRAAIDLLRPLAREYETAATPMVISGCVGPRGDGYRAGERQSVDTAEHYHLEQIEAFSQAGVDLVTAMTMTNSEEAIGIVRAARSLDLPVVVSFTVEIDGRLPSGQALEDALAEVDAATERAPAYYMINCAHPVHFEAVLPDGAPWLSRIHGLRANASTRSHAELDESTELDDGDAEDLARRYARLTALLPSLNVIGGCCGTDERHVAAMCRVCVPRLQRQPSGLRERC